MVLLSDSVSPSVALSPSRDTLDESWLGCCNLLQALLELFPDTGDGKEAGWSSPLERVDQGALESVRSREKELADITHMLENVESKASDMRQRQV